MFCLAKYEYSSIGNVQWKRVSKKRQETFLRDIHHGENLKGQEAVVEASWFSLLNDTFYSVNKGYATPMSKVLGTDGLLIVRDITVALSLITEFKDDVALEKRNYQERILAQVLFYMKHISMHIENGNDKGLELPNVVLAADANQIFVINARVLYPYLDMPDIDWSMNARKAYDEQIPQVVFDKLRIDANINPYVYDIRSRDFNLNDIMGLVSDLASTENATQLSKIPVNQANIRGAYDEFLRLVTQNRTKVKTNQELVGMFINALTNHENVILKNNTVTMLNDDGTYIKYTVNGRNWYAFFSRFDTNYSADEVKDITEVGDILLEETNRRFSGEYWTPTVWVNEAVKEISSELGHDWREKYYVWDAAAGSKNLTRDFKFKHLFSSTLFDNELAMGRMYNRENIAFQYDFLNDDISLSKKNIKKAKLFDRAPELVNALLSNKPIVLFMNPPYATAGDARMDSEHKKAGVATKSVVHEYMKDDKIGHASENLYCQFFYRALLLKKAFKLSNLVIAYFSNSQYMTGGSYFKAFDEALFTHFDFKSGFLLNAGEFSDTAANWGISFTILRSIHERSTDRIPNQYTLAIKEDTTVQGITRSGKHTIKSLPKSDFLSEWVRGVSLKSLKYQDKGTYPTFSSAFKVKPNSSITPPKYPIHALGYAWNKANNVEKAATETALFSDCYHDGHGFAIVPENFERVMINFAIRKSTSHSWINNKDNYHSPSELFLNNANYNMMLTEMVIFGLFNKYSYQVSLSNIEYKEKSYNINNEFFWLSKHSMSALASKSHFSDMGFSIEDDCERFVYKWLEKHQGDISPAAKLVLSYAEKIVEDTFKYRQELNDDYPEFCFMNWDAGWEQIRRLMTNGKKSQYLSNFKTAYDELAKIINGYIYQFGFLDE